MHKWCFTAGMTFLAVLGPKQQQGYAIFLDFSVNLFDTRWFVFGRLFSSQGREEPPDGLFLGRLLAATLLLSLVLS
jgi:hypothetical protein